MKLTRSIDITGIKFKIAGRPSFKRSNNRKVLNIYNHGNRLIPRLYFRKINKYISEKRECLSCKKMVTLVEIIYSRDKH